MRELMTSKLRTSPAMGWIASVCGLALAVTLAGCGGGNEADSTAAVVPMAIETLPTYHRLPLALDEPAAMDADGSGASRLVAPATVRTAAVYADIDTARLTDETVASFNVSRRALGTSVAPMAAPKVSLVYSPAQIRAAYKLPALPSLPLSLLSASDLAALGAGQTIYLIDAYDHPNAVADLNTFSGRFGLPNCAPMPASAVSAPPQAGVCEVIVLYANANGTTTTAAPAYNAGWAQESALDTQWAHAIAPLARIVLIEAKDSSLNSLSGAITLANTLAAGSVSMSFGAAEGSWVATTASLFNATGMSYFASTGDNGAGVSWPSVMPTVLGVGGTTLNYSTTVRTETTWSGTGGGISRYVTMPAYQNGLTIAGEPTKGTKYRAVADVSMVADPYTGVYVAFTAKGLASPSWYAFGGTSLSSPMWAGVISVANAQRAAVGGKFPLGAPHDAIYPDVFSTGYAADFYDVTTGSNSSKSCSSCKAGAGYDSPTGVGTPKAAGLLVTLVAH
jgi:subtilase family serine protease